MTPEYVFAAGIVMCCLVGLVPERFKTPAALIGGGVVFTSLCMGVS